VRVCFICEETERPLGAFLREIIGSKWRVSIRLAVGFLLVMSHWTLGN
jgi:hypothetical protein